jgi:protein-S-isoprenylcysteine O-methyltransferase Ste14
VLDTKLPPPILLLGLVLFSWLMSLALPNLFIVIPFRNIISTLFVILGLALNIYPKLLFSKADTTVNPMRPGAATHLITTGLYRYTRNPMYLGHVLVLVGWALHLQHLVAYLAIIIYVVYITRFQILPEERILTVLFQEKYLQYCERVRRWL